MSTRLILIETSTSLCSTALAEDGKIICERRSPEPRAHASLTAPFIREMLDEAGWKASDADAVCVGMGPGSYTGLRVGVSTAKGLCFGTGKPLLAVDTLTILACQAIEKGLLPQGCKAILPMVDARRMEVYAAPFTPEGKRTGEIAPVVLEASSYAPLFAEGPVAVIGDAAEKAAGVLPAKGNAFIQQCPEARFMLTPALRELSEGNFRDVAYFEPFYLKEFVATVSRKNLF